MLIFYTIQSTNNERSALAKKHKQEHMMQFLRFIYMHKHGNNFTAETNVDANMLHLGMNELLLH